MRMVGGLGIGGILRYAGGKWSWVQHLDEVLRSVSIVSSSDAWAVGNGSGYDPAGNDWKRGVIFHYNGSEWKRVISFEDIVLLGIDMVSTNDGWAVGADYPQYDRGLLLHYNGANWAQYPSPTSKGISVVRMMSATEGWAASAEGILHYQNGTWSIYQ